MIIAYAVVLGLCLGSFLNVCIHRLPRDLSLISPGSRCPSCGRPIAFYDNIPLLSWLLLRGRCRRCRAPISLRYPAVEGVTGALTALMAWRWEGTGLWVPAAAVAAGALLAIALIDWETFLIPDLLSLGLLGLGLAAAPVNPFFAGTLAARFAAAAVGAAAGFLFTWVTAEIGDRVFKRESLGGGDIKLLAAVGALSGWNGAFACLMIASFVGGAWGMAQIARGRLKRMEPMPFGPFLSLGALIVLLDLLPRSFPFIVLP